MGYAVYRQADGRWAGYGVPAECDHPDCFEKINRGLAYKCEEHAFFDDTEMDFVLSEGCGLFFCLEHKAETLDHFLYSAKEDTEEWVRWMLTDDSWATWRVDNRKQVRKLREKYGYYG